MTHCENYRMEVVCDLPLLCVYLPGCGRVLRSASEL